jgi:hypothetical protein
MTFVADDAGRVDEALFGHSTLPARWGGTEILALALN